VSGAAKKKSERKSELQIEFFMSSCIDVETPNSRWKIQRRLPPAAFKLQIEQRISPGAAFCHDFIYVYIYLFLLLFSHWRRHQAD